MNNDLKYYIEKVFSMDFTSAYPAQMLLQKYAIGTSEELIHPTEKEFIRSLNYFFCVFDATFINIRTKEGMYFDSYISKHKCYRLFGAIENNGRIVSADELTTTITEQDLWIINQFYEYDNIEFRHFKRWIKAYLPTDFVKSILFLYKQKTMLKGIPGKEADLIYYKGMLNSSYGMAVTDNISRDDILYDNGEWHKNKADINKHLNEYNNSRSRFLWYQIGIGVCAYNRRALISGMIECADDYVYSDTDSIKGINFEKHKAYFDNYNNKIREKLLRIAHHHKIDFSEFEPENIKGEKKLIGLWDFEGIYDKFKSLGAKRYAFEKDGEISITVSGLNKNITVPYLINKYGKEGFWKAFNDDLYVPKGFTGKKIHTYCDDEVKGIITDYTGHSGEYHEKSYIHLDDSDYNLNLNQAFIDYLFKIGEE